MFSARFIPMFVLLDKRAEQLEMKFKKIIAICIFLSIALVFLHSEFGVACECHGDHENHDFNTIISSTLISKSIKQQDVNFTKHLVPYQVDDQLVEIEYLIPTNYFYEKSSNLFTLKLPTFSFLQTFLF